MTDDRAGAAVVDAPRFRGNLTVQNTGAGRGFVVKNPDSGAFFRMGEVEQFITQQLDGRTSLEVVRRRAQEKFSGSLSAATLETFVRRLEKSGLLETAAHRANDSPQSRKRIRGTLLYLRVRLLDPDRIIAQLERQVRFIFFNRRFIMVSGAIVLLALGITLLDSSAIARDLSRLYRLSAIPLALALFFVIVSAHEFAHGVTCKHFGGEVHEMGFMVMYFQPAFYCNVSDAWLFPEKAKRLWVSFAGAYIELFGWAIATLIWYVTESDTPVNYLALVVMAISGVKSLLNFNPLIKLDGYYLLSDYLEMPNLRRKSFAYVGGLVKRAVGLGTGRAMAAAPRERRIYLLYGGIAAVCSLGLMAFGFLKTGGYLLDLGQPAALLALTGLVGLRSRRRLRRLFGGLMHHSASEKAAEEDDEDGSDELGSSGSAEPDSRSKRPHRRKQVPWKVVGLVVGLVALLPMRIQLRIAGPFNVLPEDNADVRAAVEGIIDQVLVAEGDSVAAGDIVARLSDRALRVELNKTQAEVRENRAALRQLQDGPTAEEIAVARAGVSKQQGLLTFAQGRRERLKGLFAMGSVTRQELEDAEEQETTTQNDLRQATSQLDMLLRGSRPELVEATAARIDRLEAQRRYIEEQLKALDIRSPVGGIVATPTRQLKAMERQFVTSGALIAKIYDVSAVTARIVVPEKEIADVRVGLPVVLKARAYPDHEFTGTVTEIATSAEGTAATSGDNASAGLNASPTSPGQAFIVTTRIDNRSHLLKPGMTGQAKVLGGDRRVLQLMERRLARTFKVQFWSWW